MENVPVASLGHGLAAAELAEVPNYRAMLAEVFDQLAADPEDFAVFRVRVDYPILRSSGRCRPVDLSTSTEGHGPGL